MRNDATCLEDILEAIRQIEKYASHGRDEFERDELIQTWVVRHIEIVGEAANGLSNELRNRHPDVPWSGIIGMRNVLVHRYFLIDKDKLWDVIENDLPNLKVQIKSILESIAGDNE